MQPSALDSCESAAASDEAPKAADAGESDEAANVDRSARTAPVASEPVVTSANKDSDEAKPRKAGWWQRKGFF